MVFTNGDIVRIEHRIRRNQELNARQAELIETLSREHPQLVEEAERLLAKLEKIHKEYHKHLEVIRKDLMSVGGLRVESRRQLWVDCVGL